MRAVNNFKYFALALALLLLAPQASQASQASQAPAAESALEKTRKTLPPGVTLLELHYTARPERRIPVWVYLPSDPRPAPVILFSHGLGGSRTGYAYLGRHWSAAGYVVVMLQHPGSDDALWRGEADKAGREANMRAAATVKNALLRVADVHGALNALETWNNAPESPLRGRLNLERTGMAGHSFGAVTTQLVSGLSLGQRGRRSTDNRIRAAVIMSPSYPRKAAQNPFASVSIPWLLMTGTEDTTIYSSQSAADRLRVFESLKPGNKYELVFNGGDHLLFTGQTPAGQPLLQDRLAPILSVSTRFWDAYLKNDTAARAWLNGAAPEKELAPGDTWKTK